MFYLSQRPYLVSGSLRDQLLYPQPPASVWTTTSKTMQAQYVPTLLPFCILHHAQLCWTAVLFLEANKSAARHLLSCQNACIIVSRADGRFEALLVLNTLVVFVVLEILV